MRECLWCTIENRADDILGKTGHLREIRVEWDLRGIRVAESRFLLKVRRDPDVREGGRISTGCRIESGNRGIRSEEDALVRKRLICTIGDGYETASLRNQARIDPNWNQSFCVCARREATGNN